MKINEQWEELKERSHANIQSERGILKRQTRSIQTEGHFGDIKENENFRRFNYRSADKVYKEFMLYAIGRNINKYHRFLYEKLKKFGKNCKKMLTSAAGSDNINELSQDRTSDQRKSFLEKKKVVDKAEQM